MKKYILLLLAFWLVGRGQNFAQNNTKTLSECLHIAMDSRGSGSARRRSVQPRKKQGSVEHHPTQNIYCIRLPALWQPSHPIAAS